jgi:MarR family transcriptional regulator, temperature-dependent positive regulator of motility
MKMLRSLADARIWSDVAPKPAAGTMTLLVRLAKVVHRRSTEELLGMRMRQFQLLSYMRGRESVPQQWLGETLWIDPNNLVLQLNELEAAGLVLRRRDPDDRRRHLVQLTPEGERALVRAERAQESIEDEVLAHLTVEERATLRELLDRALQGEVAAAAEPPAPPR